MAKSIYDEKTWKDIRQDAGFWAAGWLLFLPGGALGATAAAIGKFSKSETKPSPFSFLLRPLKAVAVAVDRAADKFSESGKFTLASAIAAAAPALLAGGTAALALGFSWQGLLAGGHILGTAGAVLGGAGAAFAAYPLAAFALVCAVTGAMALPETAKDLPKIWRAGRDGLQSTLAWRPKKKSEQSAAAAPLPSPAPELPPLMKNFNIVAAALGRQEEAERVRFLKSLRRKYPAEFADALRLESHDPELRKDIQVKKPLSFKAKRRSFRFPGTRL